LLDPKGTAIEIEILPAQCQSLTAPQASTKQQRGDGV
jgi:hypothetical protein